MVLDPTTLKETRSFNPPSITPSTPFAVDEPMTRLGLEVLKMLGNFFAKHPFIAATLTIAVISTISSIIDKIRKIFSSICKIHFQTTQDPNVFVIPPSCQKNAENTPSCPRMPDGSSSTRENSDGIAPPPIPAGAASFRNLPPIPSSPPID